MTSHIAQFGGTKKRRGGWQKAKSRVVAQYTHFLKENSDRRDRIAGASIGLRFGTKIGHYESGIRPCSAGLFD
jgi:hypothetical protein